VPPASRVIVGVDVGPMTEFLGSCPPFDVLEPDELAGLVAHAVVERYGPGAVILDAFGVRADDLFAIWQGRVDIWVHPDRLNELADETKGVGDLFGYVSALTGAVAGPRVVAVGDVLVIRLPVELVAPAFASRRGARFLAQEVLAVNQRPVGIPTYTLVDDLVDRAPVVVDPDASIAQAAALMVTADLGYAAVRIGPGRAVRPRHRRDHPQPRRGGAADHRPGLGGDEPRPTDDSDRRVGDRGADQGARTQRGVRPRHGSGR
jgi:CBS domain-containing protein